MAGMGFGVLVVDCSWRRSSRLEKIEEAVLIRMSAVSAFTRPCRLARMISELPTIQP